MAAQVAGGGVDPRDVLRQPALDLPQKGDPVGGATARVGPGEGGAGRRAEGAGDVALAAPPVVDLLPGPARGRWSRPHQIAARVAPGAERAHLVQADDHAARGRRGAGRLDPPLLSADSGSTRSPDQVSRLRRRRPSWGRIPSIRLRRMAMPSCSRRQAAKRSGVGAANGRPRRRGAVSAAAITAATSSAE